MRFGLGHRENGSTLIDLLMAIGLFGLCVLILLKYGTQILASQSSSGLVRERALLKNTLLTSVSCSQVTACRGREYRELRDRNGRVLVSPSASVEYGAWKVRAQCQTNQTLVIEAAALKEDGTPRNDPVTGKSLDWSTLIDSGMLCGQVNGTRARGEIFPQIGPYCKQRMGTCRGPADAARIGGQPMQMCCEDGRDVPPRQCPAGTRQLGAYWDREGDWGVEGKWVTLCE